MTLQVRYCPQCGTRRTGYFRFCGRCGLDFDELALRPVDGAPPIAPKPELTTPIWPPPVQWPPPDAKPTSEVAPEAVGVEATAPAPSAAVAALTARVAAPPAPAAPAAPAAPPAPAIPEPAPPSTAAIAEPAPTPAIPEPAPRASPAIEWPTASRTSTDYVQPPAQRPILARRLATPAAPPVIQPMSAPPVSVGRPAITFTRIAIVVLAALLAFNAVSRAITQSTVPPNPRPTTVLGSPLTGESPAAAAPPTETLPAITPGPSFGPTSARDFATVTKIIDGDTIQVDMSGKDYTVDYIGIDAPEPDAADPTVTAQAASATATNAALVEGHDVYLEHDVSDTDGSDRLLRNVWFVDSGGSNVLVNLELVRLGFAKVLTVEPDHKYVAYLATAENAARSEHLGIWSSAASTSGDGAPAAVPSPPGPPPSG